MEKFYSSKALLKWLVGGCIPHIPSGFPPCVKSPKNALDPMHDDISLNTLSNPNHPKANNICERFSTIEIKGTGIC